MLNLNQPLRILQTVLALITLGLNGYVAHWYISHTNLHTTPCEAPVLIAAAAFTLFALPYLFLNPALSQTHLNKPTGRYFNKYVLLGLDLLTSTLWLGGTVALAVFRSNLTICGGHVCQAMIAGVVFGAVAWVSFLATTILAFLHIMRTRASPTPEAHAEWVGTKQTIQV